MSTPLKPPPDGNQNRLGPMIGMVIGSVAIAGVFVALRMYTRLVINRSARWDDWTIALAYIASFIGLVLDAICFHYGYGRHQYYLTEHQVQEYKKFAYGDWIQTFFTLMITKISICLLLLRISPSKRIIRPIQSLIVFLVVSNIILSLLWMLQCFPLDGAWNAEKHESGKCFTQGQLQRIIITQAIISIISDFICSGFPLIILWNVRIKPRQKVLFCGLMGLGLVTAGCCIVRTVINWQNVHHDQTWVSVDNWMWRTAEINIGIIAACIPTLLPLYRLVRDKIITARQSVASGTGLFTKFPFTQSSKTSISLQRPMWGNHSRNPSNAQQSGWDHFEPHNFTKINRPEGEDVEMQIGILKEAYQVPRPYLK